MGLGEVARTWRAPEDAVLAFPGEPKIAEDIEVEFRTAEAGWQPVSISAAGWTVSFDASHVYDPFPEILGWLEAIVDGRDGHVLTNLEGLHLELFAFGVVDPQRVRVVIGTVPGQSDSYRDIKLDIDIGRRRFVRRCYGALRAYAESDRYIADEWAAISLADDLVRKGYEGKLANDMAECSAAELNDILWRLYPTYLLRFPTAAHESEEWKRGIQYLAGGEAPADMVKEPDPQFVIPAEFDVWDGEGRLAHINELLQFTVSSWLATDLRTLRSSRLDELLLQP